MWKANTNHGRAYWRNGDLKQKRGATTCRTPKGGNRNESKDECICCDQCGAGRCGKAEIRATQREAYEVMEREYYKTKLELGRSVNEKRCFMFYNNACVVSENGNFSWDIFEREIEVDVKPTRKKTASSTTPKLIILVEGGIASAYTDQPDAMDVELFDYDEEGYGLYTEKDRAEYIAKRTKVENTTGKMRRVI